jgi:hypothetical protein
MTRSRWRRRTQRTVSTALKRALWSRDRGCSFPGCRHTRYVDAHHIKHWTKGGATSLENLTLLCTYHHTLLHEGGFTIHDDERAGIYFRRPDGRVIPRSGIAPPTCSTTSRCRCRAQIPPRRRGWRRSCTGSSSMTSRAGIPPRRARRSTAGRLHQSRAEIPPRRLRGGIRNAQRGGASLRRSARAPRRLPPSRHGGLIVAIR